MNNANDPLVQFVIDHYLAVLIFYLVFNAWIFFSLFLMRNKEFKVSKEDEDRIKRMSKRAEAWIGMFMIPKAIILLFVLAIFFLFLMSLFVNGFRM